MFEYPGRPVPKTTQVLGRPVSVRKMSSGGHRCFVGQPYWRHRRKISILAGGAEMVCRSMMASAGRFFVDARHSPPGAGM